MRRSREAAQQAVLPQPRYPYALWKQAKSWLSRYRVGKGPPIW